MRVTMIGSGNVATHLSAALKNAGHQIVQVWSRDFQHASLLAYHVKAEAINDLSQLTEDTDLIILAVKDDAIAEIASQLPFKSKTVVHTAGSIEIDVLTKIFPNAGVLYPLQTFSKERSVDFYNVPVFIESSTSEVKTQLEYLLEGVSQTVTELPAKKRLALHTAAVFACNFTNYMYAVSKDILNSEDFNFSLIRPLILETATKVQELDPEKVQTGPAIRQDVGTMNKHLALLENKPELKQLYQLLSHNIINFYHRL